MLSIAPSHLAALCSACLFLLSSAAPVRAADFDSTGIVLFTNIQNGLNLGENVPYYGIGESGLIGLNIQTGGIHPTSMPTPVSPTTLQFTGVTGPNPLLPFGLNVHIITTLDGLIFCTWTATFTIQFVTETDVVFSGDGEFTIIGGTGMYASAKGTFTTLFATDSIPLTSNNATAAFSQSGTINK